MRLALLLGASLLALSCAQAEEGGSPVRKDSGAVDSGLDSDSSIPDSTDAADDVKDTSVPDDASDAFPDADADAADVAPSDGGTPASVKTLVLWLDATKSLTSTGSLVSKWPDQSGKGNHATQSSSGNQPTIVSSGIGGKRAVRFDGSTSYLVIADASTLQFGTGDFYIGVVASYANPTSVYSTFYGKFEAVSPQRGAGLFGNHAATSTSKLYVWLDKTSGYVTPSSGYNDGKARLYAVRRAGTDLELRVGGAVMFKATPPAIDVSASGQNVWVGGRGTDAQFLDGMIAEVVVLAGVTSDADVTLIEDYLTAKYGL